MQFGSEAKKHLFALFMADNAQVMKTIGRLTFNRSEKIGVSRGALVFKGKYEDEIDVAVKRILKQDVKLEISVLKKNHNHRNIIHYYVTESDEDF